MAQDRDHCWALVGMVVSLQVHMGWGVSSLAG